MDPTIVAAVIGAITTVIAAVLPLALNRVRKVKGIARGTIEELIQPISQSQALQRFSELLPQAKVVRMAGWSLLHVISENRRALRDVVERGKTLRMLLLDPDSTTVAILDGAITELDLRVRKSQGWPPVVSEDVAKADVRRALDILAVNGLLTPGLDIVHLCNSLLPFGLLMIETEDGAGWLSVQIYPMHPDIPIGRRLTFVAGGGRTELWNILEEQFDTAWEDRNFSMSVPRKQEDVRRTPPMQRTADAASDG